MDMLGKLASPASATIRQFQKIVQDIKKNDNSFLNKIRRLKSKPVPKVPARDYRDDDQGTEPENDEDLYEEICEDHSYEPPPIHRVFNTTPSASLPREEYLDNCRDRPHQRPKKPLQPGKVYKKLPPEPPQVDSDEEDYIHPDGSNNGENYIATAETPPSYSYEAPDKKKNSLHPPTNRLNRRASPITIQESSGDNDYEVCDPDDDTRDKRKERSPLLGPKPSPRERSLKPPSRLKPDFKPREFESRIMPVMQSEQRPPRTFTADFMQPKIPPPKFASVQAADCGDVSAANESIVQNKDLCNNSWYAGTCDRKTADDVLFHSNKDGAFMVRKSSGQDTHQPYTLVVFYKARVYNIPIRFIPLTQHYALGREKKGEEYFSSISHLIENHQRNPLVLIDSQSNTKDTIRLYYPVKP